MKIAPYIIKNANIKKINIKEENIIISFNIDNNRNISNIQFITPSMDNEINNTIKNAIIDARLNLVKKTNTKENIILYLNIEYK